MVLTGAPEAFAAKVPAVLLLASSAVTSNQNAGDVISIIVVEI
jgi:hypothetical protein